jgi:hypothetical protein
VATNSFIVRDDTRPGRDSASPFPSSTSFFRAGCFRPGSPYWNGDSLCHSGTFFQVVESGIYRTLRNAEDTRDDGIGDDRPERDDLRPRPLEAPPFPLDGAEQEASTTAVRLRAQSGFEEPEPAPTGVAARLHPFVSAPLRLERTPRLSEGGPEPIRLDAAGFGDSRGELVVYFPCAFQREKDETVREGGELRLGEGPLRRRRGAREYRGPAFRFPAALTFVERGESGREVGLRPFADELLFDRSAPLAPHRPGEESETGFEVNLERDASIDEAIGERGDTATMPLERIGGVILVIETEASRFAIDESGHPLHYPLLARRAGTVRSYEFV